MSPKSLRPSQVSKLVLEIHINYDVLKIFGEEGYRAPIIEEVEEFGEIRTAGAPDSKKNRDVLHPIADAFRRFRGKHCRF